MPAAAVLMYSCTRHLCHVYQQIAVCSRVFLESYCIRVLILCIRFILLFVCVAGYLIEMPTIVARIQQCAMYTQYVTKSAQPVLRSDVTVCAQ